MGERWRGFLHDRCGVFLEINVVPLLLWNRAIIWLRGDNNMSTEDAAASSSAERKAQIFRLLRKTFFVTLAVLVFKVSRRYLTTHSEGVGNFVKELQDNGMTLDDAVQRL